MTPSPAPSAYPTRLIVILGLAGFASAFTMRATDPVVPILADTFGQTVGTVALLSTAYGITYAIGQPILGPIGDAIGKARMISIATAALAVALALSAFAPDFESLLGLRLLTGLVAGGIIPLSMAAIGDRVEMASRPIALGRFISAVILGQMVGGASAGVVAEQFGWRTVFGSACVVAAVAAVLVSLMLRPRQGVTRQRPNLATIMANYRIVLTNPRALTLFACVALEGASMFGGFPFIADFLISHGGGGPSEAGLLIGGFGIGGIVFSVVVGLLIRRLRPATMIRIGGIGMALMLLVLVLPKPWFVDIATMVVCGCLFYFMHNMFQTQATELAPTARGLAVSLFAAAFFVGNAMGPVLFGLTRTAFGYPAAFLASGVVLLVLAVVAPKVVPKK
ncbi:MFS transporter [Blastochloris sulfoviridis]|uniref:MFS transporter n=1 Tax=Blastochloris sulfoviridis TaxID=50712 RepID=A0A5M6I0F2_9HYPH|nr:MFS transporter [Blastochloris sulfoviridis]KAA5601664.1 MFS transporter [Blastochloris sulfoviridis]